MEATLIFAAFLPTGLLLGLVVGSVAVYLVMTQQKILALACIPQHIATFHNIEDKDAGVIIKRYQHAGYGVERESFKRSRLSGNFEFVMKLAV
jgi:hypothetical protein